jgi:hypothetical protein
MAGDNNRNKQSNGSEISLNSRKRVVEKDKFVRTLLSLYTGSSDEKKKAVFKLYEVHA